MSSGENNFQISNCPVKGLYNYHCKQPEFSSKKDYQTRPCNLPHLSLLTFILLECGCKASNISSSIFRFQSFWSGYFNVFTVKDLDLKVIILSLFNTCHQTGVSNRILFSFQVCLTKNQTTQWVDKEPHHFNYHSQVEH